MIVVLLIMTSLVLSLAATIYGWFEYISKKEEYRAAIVLFILAVICFGTGIYLANSWYNVPLPFL